jgi:heat shock protein HslJ
VSRKSGEAALMSEVKWSLRELNDGPLLPETDITAQFSADGTVVGSAGCNRYRTVYRLGNETLTLGSPATTRMSGAPSVMQQEAEFLSTLRAVRSVRLVAKRLEMRAADGRTILVFAGTE